MGIWVICSQSIDWAPEASNVLYCSEKIKAIALDAKWEANLYFGNLSIGKV